MYKSEFQGCCGIHVVYGFDYTEATAPLTVIATKDYTSYIKAQIKDSTNVGLLLIALNENQIKSGLEKVVLEAGFKPLIEGFYHPGHGRNISLYGYENHPHRRKTAEKKEEPVKVEPRVFIKADVIESVKSVPPKSPRVRRVSTNKPKRIEW